MRAAIVAATLAVAAALAAASTPAPCCVGYRFGLNIARTDLTPNTVLPATYGESFFIDLNIPVAWFGMGPVSTDSNFTGAEGFVRGNRMCYLDQHGVFNVSVPSGIFDKQKYCVGPDTRAPVYDGPAMVGGMRADVWRNETGTDGIIVEHSSCVPFMSAESQSTSLYSNFTTNFDEAVFNFPSVCDGAPEIAFETLAARTRLPGFMTRSWVW